MPDRPSRKTKEGVVVSAKMNKTVIVAVEMVYRHPRYHKVMKKDVRFAAHDEAGKCAVGDTVLIVETRPISKTKRFRVETILKKSESK